MLALLLAIVEAITFSITVSQDHTRVFLRYPVVQGLTWLQTCVEAEGGSFSAPTWYVSSCWEPRERTEEYKLKPDARHVRGHLQIDFDGKRSTLVTPVMRVRHEGEN